MKKSTFLIGLFGTAIVMANAGSAWALGFDVFELRPVISLSPSGVTLPPHRPQIMQPVDQPSATNTHSGAEEPVMTVQPSGSGVESASGPTLGSLLEIEMSTPVVTKVSDVTVAQGPSKDPVFGTLRDLGIVTSVPSNSSGGVTNDQDSEVPPAGGVVQGENLDPIQADSQDIPNDPVTPADEAAQEPSESTDDAMAPSEGETEEGGVPSVEVGIPATDEEAYAVVPVGMAPEEGESAPEHRAFGTGFAKDDTRASQGGCSLELQ